MLLPMSEARETRITRIVRWTIQYTGRRSFRCSRSRCKKRLAMR
jgi:hypothetical protein